MNPLYFDRQVTKVFRVVFRFVTAISEFLESKRQ